ncbi:hypothetical protein N7280_04920 [Rickettsia rhipicephali]|nr:hypothetical protein [Rickettsia rhipicephali]MCX4079940.1 hypothetical protein [Rickettsia rhipicephali]
MSCSTLAKYSNVASDTFTPAYVVELFTTFSGDMLLETVFK